MKRKTSLLIIYLATSGLAAGAAFAEEQTAPDKPVEDAATAADAQPAADKPAEKKIEHDPEHKSLTEEGELLVPVAFISQPVLSKVELGIGYVSDDAYKFGRYNGLQSKGAFVLGNIKARQFYDDGRFWSVRGNNLGLESRYLRLEGGSQGSYKLFLEYDELPNYKNNTAKSPFTGIGSDNLALPSGFDINNLDASLGGFDIQTKRERIGVGAIFVPVEHWQFDVDFSHENKKGVDITGAAIASSSQQIVGNTSTSLLPEPIDYDTDKVNATLRYDGHGGQLDLSYHMSIFDNANNSLTWDNPFNPTASAGSMSLAPDNEFHQLSLSGGYYLPYRSHLTGLISMGRMTQNQDFQAYTINPAASPSDLPRNSLDGEAWLTTAQLKLSTRPLDKLRLSAELRYNERDNKTPVETYDYVRLDSTSFRTATNNPYSYKNNRFNLNANYRFNAITSLRGGYKYNEMKRSYTNAERENTKEDTFFAKWKVKPHSTVDVALLAETSTRDGSEYNTLPNENPAMRKYNMADRDRKKYGASIDFMATEKLFLSARADYNIDEYNNSTIGLTEATQPVYTLDFSYQPAHNITTYGYYTYETIESSQAGHSVSGPSADVSTANWEADFNDTFDTIGIGAKLTELGKWAMGADIVQSKSRGTIDMKDLLNPGTEGQFPDTKTSLTSIKIWTSYDVSKQLSYKLGYWFEKYSADNWAIDGLQAYDPAVVANALLLGGETLDYNTHVVTASANYRF